MDRVVTRTDPLQRQEFYQYDLTGNLTQFTDRRGIATTFQYDTLYRPTSVSFETESSITYTHDGYDRLLDVADTVAGTNLCPAVLAGASICRSYNDLLRTSSETTPQGSISYAFDYAGRRKRMTVAGQPDVNYTFDLANRLTQISQGSANTIISYDQDSRRTSLTLPNNVVTTYCYDNNSRLTGLFYGQATLCSNPSGTLGTLLYGYDALNRRNQVWGTFARTGLPQPVGSASYDAANGLLQWNGQLFSYDLNGNMTSDGTNTFTWDARNQLSQFNTTTFQYDADRRRTTNAAGTSFLYDVYNSVQELSGTTVTANRITGGADEYFSRADSTGSYAPLTDALGSTIALVNSSGNIVTQYTYDPFGNTTVSGSANGNVFQFTGRENEGNGLYYYRARYYNPLIGRFISEDPLGLESDDTNFYSYARNSPINFRDPYGMQEEKGPGEEAMEEEAEAEKEREEDALEPVTPFTQRPIPEWEQILNKLPPEDLELFLNGKADPIDPKVQDALRWWRIYETLHHDIFQKIPSLRPQFCQRAGKGQRGEAKDRTLEGTINQVDDLELAKRNQRKTRRPIDSTEKSKQNLKNKLKQIHSLEDVEEE